MIAMAVGIALIGFLVISTFVYYDLTRKAVLRAEEGARENDGRRMSEDLTAKLGDGDLSVEREWGGSSAITGVIVQCDSGRLVGAACGMTNGTITCGGRGMNETLAVLNASC